MEALMGHRSEQQIASDYQISPELVRQWKQQAMEGISGAFLKGVKTREKELEEQLVLLRNALCKREIEVEWLTKKSKELGLRTINRHPATSTPSRKREEGKYKYRLKELDTIKVDDVWTSDITYLQMERRNYYLCCVMDWESREILGWSFSERMEVTLCLEALEMALESDRCPKIFIRPDLLNWT